MTGVTVHRRNETFRFSVRVQPRASRNEVTGAVDGVLRVRLQAPPVDNQANEALVDFLAQWLGVSRRHIRIVAGFTARTKTVEVGGLPPDQLARLTSL